MGSRPAPGSNARGYADGSSRPRNPGGAMSPGRPAPGRSYASGRPAPGSRPYAGGMRPGAGQPAHVRVNPAPGRNPGRPGPAELRGRPAPFLHSGHHNYGHYLAAPPAHYELRHFWGRDYYYHDNIWYRFNAGRYWVCRPPFGYVFHPIADAVFAACSFAYFFDELYYYDTVNSNSRLIQEQNATIAANNALISQQNASLAMNQALARESGSLANSLGLVQSFASAGTEYFYNDGVFYVKGADGQYTVIVPPAGALVDTLPEDYELVDLGGNTYYKVDETIYRMAVSADGKACFEVLGQLTD